MFVKWKDPNREHGFKLGLGLWTWTSLLDRGDDSELATGLGLGLVNKSIISIDQINEVVSSINQVICFLG